MSNISIGQKAPSISLSPLHDEEILFSSSARTVITFFRFATCPFCNLRIRELEQWHKNNPEIQIVGIFGSPVDEVKKVETIHHITFPIIADTEGVLYKSYGIQKSIFGMLKGMITRMPTLIRGVMMGHIPFKTDGHLLTMPAEFIINSKEEVILSHYGKDEGDHISFNKIEEYL